MHYIGIIHAFASVFILAFFVFGATRIQYASALRSGQSLETIRKALGNTRYFQDAENWVCRRREATEFAEESMIIPTWVMMITVLGSAWFTYFGANYILDSHFISYVFGGAYAIDRYNPNLDRYQSSTFLTGSMAFLGAYLWLIRALITRLNINDISPTTYYFLSARILVACIVAGVARHFLEAFHSQGGEVDTICMVLADNMCKPCTDTDTLCSTKNITKDEYMLPVLGFVIGWRPSLWIDFLLSKVYKYTIGPVVGQRRAKRAEKPEFCELSLVQGLDSDRIERLEELDVDDCQKLSRESLIVLWLRTTYSLTHLLDWASQAYLVCFLPNKIVRDLSLSGIREIIGYYYFLKDEDARLELHRITQFTTSTLIGQMIQLDNCPTFARLKELAENLGPGPKPSQQ